MLLAIDIGNSHIVLGVYSGDELLASWRLQTDMRRTVDEYALQVLALLSNAVPGGKRVLQVAVSSVVPALTGVFADLSKKYFGILPLTVSSDIKTGLVIAYDDPRSIGADRIVNAVAMKELVGYPSVLVDFGTATTFDVLSASGTYEGGLIAPGLQISSDALFQKASKLWTIELKTPKHLIGKNTPDSMLAGIMFGYVGLVDGIIARLKRELGENMRVMATGGMASMIAGQSEHIEKVMPNLTLEGLRILAKMNS
ncbi:MAG: type III pantothenate kinase [Deltaproteobacteria bacterium]|nr:type III pantothenate kinase [Deltaproteobacteria bacterium]